MRTEPFLLPIQQADLSSSYALCVLASAIGLAIRISQ
jgi:hypothetical protein